VGGGDDQAPSVSVRTLVLCHTRMENASPKIYDNHRKNHRA
jgi:hypothetical protein